MRDRGLFAEDFDSDDDAPEVAVAVEPAPVLAIDLEAHKAELAHVWEEGRQAGLTAARAEQRALAFAALSRLDGAIQDMRAAWLAEARDSAEALARLLCETVTNALPALCARHGAGEVRAVLSEILPELADEPEVRMHIAPDLIPAVSDLLTGMTTNVRLIPEPGMGPADIRLEWRKGEAQRDTAALLARIEAILAPIARDTGHNEKDFAHVD